MARLTVCLALAASLASGAAQDRWPTEGWTSSTPEQEGMSSTALAALIEGVDSGRYGHVDRVVVVRNSRLVLDHSRDNDYRAISRGRRGELGCGADACADPTEVHPYNYLHPDFHPWYQGRRVHSLQSVTKSIAATVLAIALANGEISGVDAPLLSFFSDYDLSRVDARLQRATLADLLTMRSGIEWHEQDRPLGDSNTTIQLERADDWIQFTLDQPTDADPGTRWVYNSGGSHLMSGIVRAATGQHLDEYAREHLFAPLGIADSHWKKTPRGYADTEGGLYLEALDLAKIGLLYLRDGVWDGRRILPEGWVEDATARHVDSVNRAGWGYGYQWWRLDHRGVDIWAGLGFGDQYLLVVPAYDVVGVVNSWNLFGGTRASILTGFRDALLEAVGAH